MRRYAVSTIIGTGSMGDSFRPKLSNYTHNIVSRMPETDQQGHPTKDYCLCIFTRDDMAPVNADSDIYLFPDLGLSTVIADMPQDEKDALNAALDAHSIDRTALDGSWPFGDVVTLVGQSLHSGFTLDNFSVPDI